MRSGKLLDDLRKSVSSRMSEKRYIHTLGVEKAAILLSEYCLPQKRDQLAIAALLHDITKEMPHDAQISLLAEEGIDLGCEEDRFSVIHSFTAPYGVKIEFPEFADEEILSAIEKHTLGDVRMTVFDKIIFLADFIEESRTYQSSVKTRDFVLNSMKNGDFEHNIKILDRACVLEIDSTISHLSERGRTINERSLLAREALLSKN